MNIIPGEVPCDGCTLCCKNDAVNLVGEEVYEFEREACRTSPSGFCIAHKPNGDCVYLGAHGCTIQDRKPSRCREMDCRLIAANMSRKEARELAQRRLFNMRIYQRGRDLLRILEDADG